MDVVIAIVAAVFVSLFTSMVGVSGAFLLLPFQVSVLGFTSPADIHHGGGHPPYGIISSVFGVVSRYAMGHSPNWPLGLSLGIGGLIGMYLGARLQ